MKHTVIAVLLFFAIIAGVTFNSRAVTSMIGGFLEKLEALPTDENGMTEFADGEAVHSQGGSGAGRRGADRSLQLCVRRRFFRIFRSSRPRKRSGRGSDKGRTAARRKHLLDRNRLVLTFNDL